MKKKYMKAENFDVKFDNGEDIIEYLDLDNASRPGLEIKRVNVDFPAWISQKLEQESYLKSN